MSIRGIDGSEPIREEERIEMVGAHEERRTVRTSLLGIGTLACPACDAPVSPGLDALSPSDPLACPLCDHAAPTRDFLSMSAPTRPARVAVRIAYRARPATTTTR